ncbi:NADH dehydrogenase [Halarchaeum grantii]|uniref:NADH dehydrogenase n=1 Tax=Halarchaeum grantii TaxID=1193105 RepID=A0A830EV56_9EURY|nr:proton-conducting transporter membrane subunit [Halarchaeum grantii]GGL32855.1 NADH dehydrogenase [Halarchaeum grantii]
MTTNLVVAPLLVALVSAVACMLVRTAPRLQRALSLAGVVGYALAVAALVARLWPADTLAYQVGDWPAPYGITLVADPLSVFMLAMTAVVAPLTLVYSLRYVNAPGQRVSYHALFHFLLVGATGAFLTGDVFNLFVWFEVTLMASYGLVAFYSGKDGTLAATRYVVLNLVGSSVMLLAVGGIYGVTGTLNMADIARWLASATPAESAPVLGLSLLLLAVFGLKAGLVPFQWWVPAAYSAAPAPAAAMLAGVAKKVGVYAIVRLGFTVFAAASPGVVLPGVESGLLGVYGPVLFVLAGASALVGGFVALDRPTLEETFAYSSIAQVGFIVLPLAVAAAVPDLRAAGVAAALVYALNHALAKPLLFLVTGTISDAAGTTDLGDLGGLAGRTPVLAGAFLVGGLSLVGIPPLAGFFSKLLVFRVAAVGGSLGVLAVAVTGAILTIAYVSRTWNRGFWGERTAAVETMASPDRVQVAVVVAFAACVLAVGVGFDPVYRFAEAAGHVATGAGRDAYVRAVLGGGGA